MRALAVGAFALGVAANRGDRAGCNGDRAFVAKVRNVSNVESQISTGYTEAARVKPFVFNFES
jgi:hypothetical protein